MSSQIISILILVLLALDTHSVVEHHAQTTVFWYMNRHSEREWHIADYFWQPTLQGIEAVEALLEATPDTPSYMIGMSENRVHRVPLVEAVALVRYMLLSI
jgi:6-phosphofructokinase